LNSNIIKSKCVDSCISSLYRIRHHSIKLVWVPGHSGVVGNELADVCARKGSESVDDIVVLEVLVPLVDVSNAIEEIAMTEMITRWSSLSSCGTSRLLWPKPNRGRTKTLLGFGKPTVRLLTGVLTGHCIIGRMAEHMGDRRQDFCRNCKDEEEEESVHHLLCDCPGLQKRRLKYLGCRFFYGLGCLADVGLNGLAEFCRSSGVFWGVVSTG
jgi:hypothetical protein